MSIPNLAECKTLGNRNHQLASGKRLSECRETRCVRTRLNIVDLDSSYLRSLRSPDDSGPNSTLFEPRRKPDDGISAYRVGDGIKRAQPADRDFIIHCHNAHYPELLRIRDLPAADCGDHRGSERLSCVHRGASNAAKRAGDEHGIPSEPLRPR